MIDDRYERYLGELASDEGMPEAPSQDVGQSGAPGPTETPA
jgi:hypothetical protein